MDKNALTRFASSRVPPQARMLCRAGNLDVRIVGMPDQCNLSAIMGVYRVMLDVCEPEISGKENIFAQDPPFTYENALPALQSYTYLRNLLVNEPSEYDHTVLVDFVAQANRLRNNYLKPAIARCTRDKENAIQTWNRLYARHMDLLRQTLDDPQAIDQLHDEFYPERTWDAGLRKILWPREPSGPNVVSLDDRRKKRKNTLKGEFQSNADMTNLLDIQEVIGFPDIIAEADTDVSFNATTIVDLERKSDAIGVLADSLQVVLNPPTARVYVFAAKGPR